jgi:hypothetical protein
MLPEATSLPSVVATVKIGFGGWRSFPLSSLRKKIEYVLVVITH